MNSLMKREIAKTLFVCSLFVLFLTGCGEEANVPMIVSGSEVIVKKGATEVGDFTVDYFVEADGWLIEDYRGSDETVVIPETFQIEGVTLPITGIYKNAFNGRSSIKEVRVGENVSYIGEGAFDNTNIEAFYATPRLVHVSEDSFKGSLLTFKTENGAKYIPSLDNPHCIAFGGEKDVPVKFHNDTKSVADHAFDECAKTALKLPSGIRSIGDAKLGTYDIDSLGTNLTLLHVGEYALAGSKVVSLNLMQARGRLGDYAFYNCQSLQELNLGPDVSEIGKHCFSATIIKDIVIPENIRLLDEGAFALHKGNSLVIGSKLQKAEAGVFNMSTFKKVTLPYSQADDILASSAFIEIGELILHGEGELPEKDYAQRGILKMTLKGKPKGIPEGFASHFPNLHELSLYLEAEDFLNLPNRMELYTNKNLTISYYPVSEEGEASSFTFPSTFTEIPDYVLSGCKNITEVVLPGGVTSIGAYAFYDSGLQTINLPASLTLIKDYAFDCTPDPYTRRERDSKVKDVYVDGSLSSWLSLKGKENLSDVKNVHLRFGGKEATSIELPSMTKLGNNVFPSCTGITEMKLPSNLTYLEDRCLLGTSITSLTLPSSVRFIGDYAFPDALESLSYEGTSLEWLQIERETLWASNANISVIHCNDGDISVYQWANS